MLICSGGAHFGTDVAEDVALALRVSVFGSGMVCHDKSNFHSPLLLLFLLLATHPECGVKEG